MEKIEFEDIDKFYEMYGIKLEDFNNNDEFKSLYNTLNFITNYQAGGYQQLRNI